MSASLKYVITGLAQFRKILGYMPKKVATAIQVAQEETAMAGQEFAKGSAPLYTGQVIANILSFKQNKTSWVVISKTPSSDPLPINVLFDTGEYENITGYSPRDPNTLFFMQKTYNFIDGVYTRRLKYEIEKAIKMK